jgi:hypothetical protein
VLFILKGFELSLLAFPSSDVAFSGFLRLDLPDGIVEPRLAGVCGFEGIMWSECAVVEHVSTVFFSIVRSALPVLIFFKPSNLRSRPALVKPRERVNGGFMACIIAERCAPAKVSLSNIRKLVFGLM